MTNDLRDSPGRFRPELPHSVEIAPGSRSGRPTLFRAGKGAAGVLAVALTANVSEIRAQVGAGASGPSLAWTREKVEAGDGPARKKVDAERAWLSVPRDWTTPQGARFRLQVLRFKATVDPTGPPILYLAGGPGGSSTGSVTGDRFPLVQRLRALGDVVAMDQRGVYSEPFPICRTPVALPFDRPFDPNAFLIPLSGGSRRCAEEWSGQGVDLSVLDTHQSVRDLDALREALGVPAVRILGISYGTHLGLALIRHFPQSVSAAVLAGVEGPDHTLKTPDQLESHLRRLAEVIVADANGRAALPDPIRTFREVRASLKTPRTVTVGTREGSSSVTVGALDLDRAFLDMTSERGDIEQFPRRLAQLSEGNFEPLAQWALLTRRLRGLVPLSYVADCASGASPGRRARIAREEESTERFRSINWPFPEICRDWPFKDAGDDFRSPLTSNVRALFISGDLDGRTPKENADEVGRGFANGRHLLVQNGGHDDDLLIGSARIGDEILKFLEGGAEPQAVVRLPPLRFHK